jgi:hypothetical protein
MSTEKSDFTDQKFCRINQVKIINDPNNTPGILSLDSFRAIKISTKGYKFKRDDAYEETKVFLYTNIVIYIYSLDENEKRKQAISQINSYQRVISRLNFYKIRRGD